MLMIYKLFLKPRGRFSGLKLIFPPSAAEYDGPSRGPSRERWTGLAAFFLGLAMCGIAHGQSVLTYHGSPDRSGNFVVPALTWERARSVHLDPSFHPRISGHLFAQPLYWRPPGSAFGQLLVF